MQNQARSSYTSPMCTSSQSSTAASPDSSTIRLPIRKSPCTSRGGDDGGRWRPASGTPIRTSRWCRPSRRAGRATRRAGRSASGPRRRVGAVDRRQRVRALLQSRWRPGRRARGGSAGRWSRRRSRRRSGTDCPVRQGNCRPPGCADGGPGGGGALLDPASSSMPACTSSGGPVRRISAAAAVGDGVERPCHAARPAGQRPQVLDDSPRRDRPQHRRELLFHLRPKPKSRWATRRIWISSAPSVIR